VLRGEGTRLVCGVLLVHVAGVLGCPQLLDDGFDTVRLSPDGGLGGMTLTGGGGTAGSSGSAGSGGSGSSAGSGGTQGGSGGTADTGGTGGTGGTAGTAGTGGASAGTGGSSAGTGGTGGTSGDTPACWTFELTTDAANPDSNCIGIEGWNNVVDEAPTSISISYEDGDVCFSGTVGSSGWATYSYVFIGDGDADDGVAWDATEFGVTGFELTTTGDALPTSLLVTYAASVDDNLRDYCQTIGTGTALVPFAGAARDNCSGSNTGALTDTTALEALRLSFPVPGTAYAVDFCLHIRAF